MNVDFSFCLIFNKELKSWGVTIFMVDSLSGLKQWWPTWMLAPMKRCVLIILRWYGRLRRKRQWIHHVARQLIIPPRLRQWASFLYESWKAPSLLRPLQYTWCTWNKTALTKNESQEWWCWWNLGCNRGVYSAPSQGSEGSSTVWEMLLPLQQLRTFYPWMPIGEGIQNGYPFKPKEGMALEKGAWTPQVKMVKPKAPQEGMP